MVADCTVFDSVVVLIIVSMLVLGVTESVTGASIERVWVSATVIIEIDV